MQIQLLFLLVGGMLSMYSVPLEGACRLVVGVVGPEDIGYGSILLVVRFIPRRRSCAVLVGW